MNTEFFVDKTYRTFADTLTAFGFARLLEELMSRQQSRDRSVHILDKGAYYSVVCQPGVDPMRLESLRHAPLSVVRAIPTKFYNEEKLPAEIPTIDWDEITTYFAALKAGNRDNPPPKPGIDLDILFAINPEAIQGYNGLLFDWWIVRAAQPEIFRIMLNLYSVSPNNIEEAVDDWEKLSKVNEWNIASLITGQQLYSPDQGMGLNEVKIISSRGLNTSKKPKINFWLTEWLRTVGFYEVAIPRLVGDVKAKEIDKDRKIFVLEPRSITYADNSQIINRFKLTLRPETPVQFDILAVLNYLITLIGYFNEPERRSARQKLGAIKHTVVAGFHTAYYKKMGQARSLMNLAFIALPGWVVVNSPEDISLYIDPEKGLLTQLVKFTRQFDESHSDAFTLLQHLRDFVSGDDLKAFFRFTNAFPAYYMGMRERGKFALQFSTVFIERLIMSTEKSLTTILESAGFHNIAYAIRQSTVTAQYRKSQGDRKYDVRYGLGQELSRKARYPQQFISELSDFLHKYNAENARVMETRPGPYRRSIQTSDIDEIVQLIDEFGSATVANLLIAYGHARIPREEEVQTEQEN